MFGLDLRSLAQVALFRTINRLRLMKTFDPQQLDNRWHGSPTGRSLLHPSLQGQDFDGNLAAHAKSLIETIESYAQRLDMRECLGSERLSVVNALIDSLKTAVLRESAAWQRRILEESSPQTEEGTGEAGLAEPPEEELVLEVDEFERIVGDLDGLLELYLQDPLNKK